MDSFVSAWFSLTSMYFSPTFNVRRYSLLADIQFALNINKIVIVLIKFIRLAHTKLSLIALTWGFSSCFCRNEG